MSVSFPKKTGRFWVTGHFNFWATDYCDTSGLNDPIMNVKTTGVIIQRVLQRYIYCTGVPESHISVHILHYWCLRVVNFYLKCYYSTNYFQIMGHFEKIPQLDQQMPLNIASPKVSHTCICLTSIPGSHISVHFALQFSQDIYNISVPIARNFQVFFALKWNFQPPRNNFCVNCYIEQLQRQSKLFENLYFLQLHIGRRNLFNEE